MNHLLRPLLLTLILSSRIYSQVPDTTSAVPPPAPVVIEMIAPDKMLLVGELLSREGMTLPPGPLVGIAFDPAAINHNILMVITLDQELNLVKTVYTVSPAFYSNLTAVPQAPAPIMPPPAAAPAPALSIVPPAVTAADRQDGRIYFITSTALRTLVIYPSGFGTLLADNGDESGRTIAGLSLLTFGGSLYGSYRFTKNMELGYGRVAMMNYGGELACTYSALASRLVYGMNIFKSQTNPFTYEVFNPYGPAGYDTTVMETTDATEPGKILAIGAMVGFPLGIYLGSRLNIVGNYQYGNADIIRFFGRSAWLYGYLLPLYGSGGNKYDYNLAAAGLTMALVPAGLYTGYKLVQGHDYSSGRGFMIEATGIMGATTGLLAPLLFDLDFDGTTNRRILITSIMSGHALGTMLGFKYKPEESYTFFQGVFTALSGACGSALCLSVPFLAQADDEKPYIAAGLIGGWGGFVAGERLAKSLFEVSGQDKRQSNVDVSLPIAWQWPLLLTPQKGAHSLTAPEHRVELVRATVNF
jgi:hypothetical protein